MKPSPTPYPITSEQHPLGSTQDFNPIQIEGIEQDSGADTHVDAVDEHPRN